MADTAAMQKFPDTKLKIPLSGNMYYWLCQLQLVRYPDNNFVRILADVDIWEKARIPRNLKCGVIRKYPHSNSSNLHTRKVSLTFIQGRFLMRVKPPPHNEISLWRRPDLLARKFPHKGETAVSQRNFLVTTTWSLQGNLLIRMKLPSHKEISLWRRLDLLARKFPHKNGAAISQGDSHKTVGLHPGLDTTSTISYSNYGCFIHWNSIMPISMRDEAAIYEC